MAKKELRLSDQVIIQVREILQLCMLTGTPLADHLRALRVEESPKNEGVLMLSEAYCLGWNEMAEKLVQQAQEKAEMQSTTMASDEPGTEEGAVVESDHEIVLSRDPGTGKLVGTREKIKN